MLSASPEKRVDLRRLYTLITYLEDGETRGSGGLVENTAMRALEEVWNAFSVRAKSVQSIVRVGNRRQRTQAVERYEST